MILIDRGMEPKQLVQARERELPRLQAFARERRITGEDITGYQIVAERLWERQHHKCCYCEDKVRERHNDVEHHRPKGRADRNPGCAETYGYWWLAFDWENLLFACRCCNRSEKNDLFPLAPGDTPLLVGEKPPGRERAYLLDPGARVNPVEHIEFEYRYSVAGEPRHLQGPKQWFARPRDGSLRGHWTIRVCGLNDGGLVELRKDHIDNYVRPRADDLKQAIAAADETRVRCEFARACAMLSPKCNYVALAYDAFRLFVPNGMLAPWKLSWPEPKDVGLPPRPLPVRRRPAAR